MMCNRSIELHPYEHITKMGLPIWGVSISITFTPTAVFAGVAAAFKD